MKREMRSKIIKICKEYKKGDLSMGDLLATLPCGRLTIGDAHEVYMLMQQWANGDEFYTKLGDGDEKTLYDCLDQTKTIVLP